ncbi:MAG: cupin domain-containing protein [Chloroflexi bacterium]|nr:cupin domain-containing protein [Chloroflexota bacterium]
MAEREAVRHREGRLEVKAEQYYEEAYELYAQARERARRGKVVVRGKDLPWVQSRQSTVKYFLSPGIEGLAIQSWRVFIHNIRSHTGRHRHQGGLALYVLEGKGYTTVDGVRHDWEEGDLVLLPIKPGGVVHQHFNTDPEKPCKWLALIYEHFHEATGYDLEQVEVHPDWKPE